MASAKTLIKRCKTQFGTTKDPYDAGYILPDGSMLDFKRSSYSKYKHHDSITRCLPEYSDLERHEAMNKFMKETGTLRVSVNPRKSTRFEGVANVKPTSAQARILGRHCGEYEGCEWSIRTPESTNCEWGQQPTGFSEYMRAFKRCKAK